MEAQYKLRKAETKSMPFCLAPWYSQPYSWALTLVRKALWPHCTYKQPNICNLWALLLSFKYSATTVTLINTNGRCYRQRNKPRRQNRRALAQHSNHIIWYADKLLRHTVLASNTAALPLLWGNVCESLWAVCDLFCQQSRNYSP